MGEDLAPLLPRYFFITSGRGTSRVSKLNAFDRALLRAGIGDCNLICVSSIIPPGAELIEPIRVPTGLITYVVMARMDGEPGDLISAGVAWAWMRGREEGEKFGVIVEGHGNDAEEALAEKLRAMCADMAEARGMVVEDVGVRVESLKVPSGCYGSVVAAAVLLPDLPALASKVRRVPPQLSSSGSSCRSQRPPRRAPSTRCRRA